MISLVAAWAFVLVGSGRAQEVPPHPEIIPRVVVSTAANWERHYKVSEHPDTRMRIVAVVSDLPMAIRDMMDWMTARGGKCQKMSWIGSDGVGWQCALAKANAMPALKRMQEMDPVLRYEITDSVEKDGPAIRTKHAQLRREMRLNAAVLKKMPATTTQIVNLWRNLDSSVAVLDRNSSAAEVSVFLSTGTGANR